MKRAITGMMILAAAIFFFSPAVKAEDSPAGIWKTIADEGADKGKAKSHLQLYEVGGKFYAKVTKLLLKPQDTLCDKCKGALYNKPVLGMVIMATMAKTGKVDKDFGDEYAGGQIMDPDNGKYYRCKFWVKGNVMVVRGYLGPFYRTQRWYKVQ